MFRIIIFILLFLLPQNALAVKIRNFDEVTREVTLEFIGKSMKTVKIEPNAFYTTNSPRVVLHIKDQEPVRTYDRQEYVIKNGVLHIQRHDYFGR